MKREPLSLENWQEPRQKNAVIHLIMGFYNVTKDVAEGIYTMFIAVVGIAIIGVLLSKKSNTEAVINNVKDNFNELLRIAGEDNDEQT